MPAWMGRCLVAMLLGIMGGLPVRAQPAPPADLGEIRTKAEHEDLEAQNAMGNVYTNALLGEKQDYAAALKWYRRAAEKGYAAAQFNLGLAHELGRGLPTDERQAFKYYLMAAEQGFAAAQFNVGNMYSAGRGVGQDLFEANLWYKQAAEKGVIEAQFNLGLAYEAGRGVKKDEMQAARWYKQAADRGFARAQYNLGLLLEDGRGMPKNEAMAAGFYRAAAEQGFAAAQNNYGLMLSEGRGGLAKDPLQAYVWLSRAVANGSNPAARDFVAKSLSADQLASAQSLLSEPAATKPPPAVVAQAPAPVRPESPTQAAPLVVTSKTPPRTPAPENAAATARITELNDALAKTRQANAQLTETNVRLELAKARLEQEIAQGRDSAKVIEQLRDQTRQLTSEVQAATNDRNAAQRVSASLAAQMKDAQAQLEIQKSAAKSAQAPAAPVVDAAKYENQIAALTTKLEQASGALNQLQQSNQQLGVEKTRLEQELSKTAATDKLVEQQRDQSQRLSEQLKAATADREAAQREAAMLTAQVKDVQQELARQKAAAVPAPAPAAPVVDVAKYESQIAALTTKLEQASGALNQLQQANQQLTEGNAQLLKEKEDLAAAKDANLATAARVAELTDLVAKARDANNQYAEANQRLELEKARLEQQLAKDSETGKLVEQLREQGRRLSEQVQAATADKDSARREAAALAAQVKDVQQELAQQKAAIASTPATPAVDVAPFEKQIAALTAQLEQTGVVLSQLQRANQQLTEGNAQLLKEKASLAAARDDGAVAAARVAELTDLYEKARLANSQHAEATQRLEQEKARLEQELAKGSETEKLVPQLRDQSRRLSEQLVSATADREAAQRETAVLAAQIKDVQQELARQKAAAATAPAPVMPVVDVARYESQIAALTTKLEQAGGALAQLQQANQQLTEGNAQLVKEKEALAAAKAAPAATADAGGHPVSGADKDAVIANLQRDKTRLNDEVKRSTLELLSLNQQLRTLRNQLAARPVAPATGDNAASAVMRTENQRVDSNNTRLLSQRDAAVTDAETLNAQLREARTEITRLNEQLAQLRTTRQSSDAASDQLAQLTSKAAQAAEEAGRMQQENTRLTARIAELEKQSKPAADRSLAPQLAQAEATVAQLQQQVKALQADKTGLEQLNRTAENWRPRNTPGWECRWRKCPRR